MNFSQALQRLKSGDRVSRLGWNGKDQYIERQSPNAASKMSAPYLYLKNTHNVFVPWIPSQGDLFANDWTLVDDQGIAGEDK